MLSCLRGDASERGLSNISYLQATWQEAANDLQADIVICSHVLYPIRDIVPFLAKLQAAALHGCYPYMFAPHLDAPLPELCSTFPRPRRHLPPHFILTLEP